MAKPRARGKGPTCLLVEGAADPWQRAWAQGGVKARNHLCTPPAAGGGAGEGEGRGLTVPVPRSLPGVEEG